MRLEVSSEKEFDAARLLISEFLGTIERDFVFINVSPAFERFVMENARLRDSIVVEYKDKAGKSLREELHIGEFEGVEVAIHISSTFRRETSIRFFYKDRETDIQWKQLKARLKDKDFDDVLLLEAEFKQFNDMIFAQLPPHHRTGFFAPAHELVTHWEALVEEYKDDTEKLRQLYNIGMLLQSRLRFIKQRMLAEEVEEKTDEILRILLKKDGGGSYG